MLPTLIHRKLAYWKCEAATLAPQVMNSFNDLSGQHHATRGNNSAILAQAKGI